jgi:hypothetical protein
VAGVGPPCSFGTEGSSGRRVGFARSFFATKSCAELARSLILSHMAGEFCIVFQFPDPPNGFFVIWHLAPCHFLGFLSILCFLSLPAIRHGSSSCRFLFSSIASSSSAEQYSQFFSPALRTRSRTSFVLLHAGREPSRAAEMMNVVPSLCVLTARLAFTPPFFTAVLRTPGQRIWFAVFSLRAGGRF